MVQIQVKRELLQLLVQNQVDIVPRLFGVVSTLKVHLLFDICIGETNYHQWIVSLKFKRVICHMLRDELPQFVVYFVFFVKIREVLLNDRRL